MIRQCFFEITMLNVIAKDCQVEYMCIIDKFCILFAVSQLNFNWDFLDLFLEVAGTVLVYT